jgi:putative methyltransferase (TIGR04325 family)
LRHDVAFHRLLKNMLRILAKRLLGRGPKYFTNYAAARTFCGTGYEADDLTSVIAEKTKRFRDQQGPAQIDAGSLRIVTALSGFPGPVRVLDFGGACGLHFFLSQKILGEIAARWCVVETKGMVAAARPLFETPALKFASSIQEATEILGDGITLVFVSGSIHFPEHWRAVLNELLSVPCNRFFLTRTPAQLMPNQQERITVQESLLSQNGFGPFPPGFSDRKVIYPHWVLDRQTLLKEVASRRKIIASFDEGEGYFGIFA